MTPGQLDIFTTPAPQNNVASQQQLNDGSAHFGSQALVVFKALMRGEVMDQYSAIRDYNFWDLRPRIAKILKAGFKVTSEEIAGTHGALRRFMSHEDFMFNNKMLNNPGS